MPDTLYQSMLTSQMLGVTNNTPEEIEKVQKLVATSKTCQTNDDVSEVLMALGIFTPRRPDAGNA